MKASKLRTGNYVLGISNTPEIVELVSMDEIDTNNHDSLPINQVEPIPITEQWLLDFGFENGNKEMSNCDLWDKWWIGDFVLDKEPDDGFWFYFHNGSAKVHYVHQLQNLFYALTNKELIKSK